MVVKLQLKVILSGSSAELASVTLDSALGVPSGGTGQTTIGSGNFLVGSGATTFTTVGGNGTGNVVRTTAASGLLHSGSFSGSFIGDGSGLTGLPAAAIDTYNTAGDNRLITSVDGTTVQGEANLTFDGSVLDVSGDIQATQITASSMQLSGIPAYSSDAVVVRDDVGSLDIGYRVIDSRVWGSTLVDNGGGGTSNTRVPYFSDANTLQGNSNFTYDGSTLTVGASAGGITTGGSVTGSALMLTGVSAGTDNTVLVLDSSGNVVSDEIDSRVWGSTLVDNSGGGAASTRIATWSDGDSLSGDAGLTYAGSVLSVGSSTFGTDVNVAGNLIIAGTASFQHTDSLVVADRFILLNSGSSSGDGGIIIQTDASAQGAAFGWDDSATRFSLQVDTKLGASATSIAPDAYVAAVVDVDAGMSDIAAHLVNGNIKIDSGDIYIYA